MATFDFATETSRITSRPAIATRAANAISNVYRAWKNRRAFYRLGEMSDSELADIGLTRADLHVAIEVPFGRDPTERLRVIATDRMDTIEDLARKVA
ncbi:MULTISPECIES: DUF1127 domain-containing protein [unclassified Mesorhizobium]|uniref:DUF1127 domain-containing protein n=1 Tax=unclassified Mesorhizobium TaxID=325217 RepID=UPI000F74CEE8|nr:MULTISPECIES: DUF1127 domain-containing protein [unclassified Mesorhizobium]AZO64441.1 DUF1127 domain-containing protein [Mesorhizobium sp. M6A.T.Cr.TU.016.01.1.1]RWP55173.1 MAG: DUF1127 domain-containing protein [Mesorhizobium sp.]RWP72063.1 MAG: DUF1127 domain-containing protein [Mesorhizobium sp.]RWQ70794.1 MAG: DUF1127 domain-containing protein [Mesorhizobium sp.]